MDRGNGLYKRIEVEVKEAMEFLECEFDDFRNSRDVQVIVSRVVRVLLGTTLDWKLLM